MDLDDIINEVLTEYEVELSKRDFRELIALCFDELDTEGEIPETALHDFFRDLDIEPAVGMLAEIIYRINEIAEETDSWSADSDEEA